MIVLSQRIPKTNIEGHHCDDIVPIVCTGVFVITRVVTRALLVLAVVAVVAVVIGLTVIPKLDMIKKNHNVPQVYIKLIAIVPTS